MKTWLLSLALVPATLFAQTGEFILSGHPHLDDSIKIELPYIHVHFKKRVDYKLSFTFSDEVQLDFMGENLKEITFDTSLKNDRDNQYGHGFYIEGIYHTIAYRGLGESVATYQLDFPSDLNLTLDDLSWTSYLTGQESHVISLSKKSYEQVLYSLPQELNERGLERKINHKLQLDKPMTVEPIKGLMVIDKIENNLKLKDKTIVMNDKKISNGNMATGLAGNTVYCSNNLGEKISEGDFISISEFKNCFFNYNKKALKKGHYSGEISISYRLFSYDDLQKALGQEVANIEKRLPEIEQTIINKSVAQILDSIEKYKKQYLESLKKLQVSYSIFPEKEEVTEIGTMIDWKYRGGAFMGSLSPVFATSDGQEIEMAGYVPFSVDHLSGSDNMIEGFYVWELHKLMIPVENMKWNNLVDVWRDIEASGISYLEQPELHRDQLLKKVLPAVKGPIPETNVYQAAVQNIKRNKIGVCVYSTEEYCKNEIPFTLFAGYQLDGDDEKNGLESRNIIFRFKGDSSLNKILSDKELKIACYYTEDLAILDLTPVEAYNKLKKGGVYLWRYRLSGWDFTRYALED